ncbi:ArsR family transcriptional regulator (plasmid) [Rhodococcus pyridinivorans SB3094]|uniref:ArsR family transcriptional regulator n=1 Tax=Rhodococcus pyridinivorans SB3094 TaxID=1435356 RepID=V9XL52_9NOCA|nr:MULTISPECIES: Rv2640c family ArsR-like transcriptional regulator [Rhodococcus]AHD24181.1 ArsR family transcriptional regulator [Rhodococcus pyridinivorans SB3094]AYA23314.1 transcriptional regulator [Rhodococcus rhodochrous]WAL49187.1 metalloregulator ArsR/SmtB family transcription factor [Rhodococcus pyridinivorans]
MPKALPVIDVSAPICCAPVSAAPMSDNAALELALRLKALADPVRIKLVSILLTADDGEVCTCDLATGVDLAESTVSHHLGQLRKAGMVESERRGMNVFYRARAESLEALRAVLDPNCCR